LTGKAKKVREVSRLARVQLIFPFSRLYAAVSDAASVLSEVSGSEDSVRKHCGAGKERTSEVRIPREHLQSVLV
jgi:hypothetical protein